MAVFFIYERLGVLFRVALPLALGVDMLHSFYYVGKLLQEKRYLNAERSRRHTLHTTTTLFKQVSKECLKTDYSFWPAGIQEKIAATVIPDVASMPKPSYELDDDEELPLSQQSFVRHRLQNWLPTTAPPTSTPTTLSAADSVESRECEIMGEEEEVVHRLPRWDVGAMVEGLYRAVVPYPVRHPVLFLDAVCVEISREIRRHVKRSDGYFEKRGKWLRAVLHVPFVIIERRSALRFRIRREAALDAVP